MISIIIPVYNTALYLGDCLDSVLSQTYNDFEVIIVNDGSTDNSLEICQDYANHNDNIMVFTQENQGQNAAILYGLEKASGELVCFVDSDDWIEPNMLQRLEETMAKHNSDCVICRTCRDNETDKPSQPIKEKELYTKEDIISEIYPSLFCNMIGNIDTSVSNSRYAKLFKKKKLFQISQFMNMTIKHGEDCLMSKPYILICESICFINDVLYHYRRNSNSISSFQEAYLKEMIIMISSLKKACTTLSEYDFNDQFQAMTLNLAHYAYIQIVDTNKFRRGMFRRLSDLCKDPMIQRGMCPQQSSKYSQAEIYALNAKKPLLLYLLAIGRGFIASIKKIKYRSVV